MKQYIKYIFIAAIIFPSCVALKPDSSQLSTPDYNKRVEVSDAHFDKVLTPVGYGSIVMTTMAGGYLGYKSDMIQHYSGTERKTFNAGGALIGAATGFTISYLLNKAFGWGQVVPVTDANKWLEKANKNYILLSNSGSHIKVIHKSAESGFVVKNINDVEEFTVAFPVSNNSDNVFNKGIEICQRDDMPTLINYFPNSKLTYNAKAKYVKISPTFEEIILAEKKYPSLGLDLENEYCNLIKTISNAIDFKARYPNTLLGSKSVCNAFSTEANSKKDVESLESMYIENFYLNANALNSYGNNIKKRNYLLGLFLLENPLDLFEVDDFFQEYKWIDYSYKGNDVIEKYWSVGVKTINDGSVILGALYSLNGKYDLSANFIKSYVNLKLEEEVKNNVKFNKRILESENSQWNDWLKNNNLTAGLVAQKGDIMYLVYGEVTNNSLFDLPIEISAKGDLRAKYDIQGTDAVTNFLINATKMFAQSQGGNIGEDKYVTTVSERFIIPSLQSKSKSSYAVLLNFGEIIGNMGVNAFDLLKSTKKIYLSNEQIAVVYNKTTSLSNERLNMQQSWQEMASKGLPESKMTDLTRGGEVDDAVWKQKYVEIQEARRRAAIEGQQRLAANGCFTVIQERVPVTYTGDNGEVKTTGTTIRCNRWNLEKTIYYNTSERYGAGYYIDDGGIATQDSRITSKKDIKLQDVYKKACNCY